MALIPALIKDSEHGPYYKVKLAFLPNIGDRITLYSHVDEQDGHQAQHAYKVLGIVHELHDCPDNDPRHAGGYHAISILVQPITQGAR